MSSGESRLSKGFATAFALALGLLASVALASTERVALVIGNASYEVGRLSNPVNDANDVATALRKLEFDVTLGIDLGREEMLRKLDTFRRGIKPGGLALVFYAGHAVEVDGQNWLLPVRNRAIGTQADVPIYSVSAQDVLRKIEEGGARLNLLVLDACRDNPLPAGARSASRGLGAIAAGSSTLVAYSTAPGKTAADGSGRNSPYASALVAALSQERISVTDLFNQVGADVMRRTGGAQVPWNSNTPIWPPIRLRGDSGTDMSIGNNPTPAPPFDPRAAELAFWQGTQLAGTADAYQAYLSSYPNGEYVALARIQNEKLAKQSTPVISTESRPMDAGRRADPVAEQATYDSAFEILKEGRYADAARAFQSFLTQYPDGELAGRAHYWLGESYYVAQQYQVAMSSFEHVASHFPNSEKVPDALLKVGYCRYELKQWDQARDMLGRVIRQYPDTTVARLAAGRLRALEREKK